MSTRGMCHTSHSLRRSLKSADNWSSGVPAKLSNCDTADYERMLSRVESDFPAVQPQLDHGLIQDGSMTVDNLYTGVSYRYSPSLTIAYEHDAEAKLSRWALQLEGEELGLIEGELELSSSVPFTTHVYTANLSGDYMEEIILHICPEGGDPMHDGQLHVFSQQNGGNSRVRTFHPFVGDALIHVLAITSGGEYGSFAAVDIVGTGPLDVIRLSGGSEDMFLWYSYDSHWERVG